jgi:hypothetical protein
MVLKTNEEEEDSVIDAPSRGGDYSMAGCRSDSRIEQMQLTFRGHLWTWCLHHLLMALNWGVRHQIFEGS